MSAPPNPKVSLYGRTYLDAEVTIPLESLTEGKGKIDSPVNIVVGGFPANAARAIDSRVNPGLVHVVTAISGLDVPRLRKHLPDGVVLRPIDVPGDETQFPDISVIINPATTCRILRDPKEDVDHWDLKSVAADSLQANLHVLGRLPMPFVKAMVVHCRSHNARLAWCGGGGLPEEVERDIHIVMVNAKEADELLGTTDQTTHQKAQALAKRATLPDAVRVVTGAGTQATVAAVRNGDDVSMVEASPNPISKDQITQLLGTGDVFATGFLIAACFDESGAVREKLAVEEALTFGLDEVDKFLVSPTNRVGVPHG